MTPTNPINEIATTMQTEIGNVVPEVLSAAGGVLGTLAPAALTLAGLVAVITIGIGFFRRLFSR